MIKTIGTSVRDLYKSRPGKRLRKSSYDTTGGNRDFLRIASGTSKTIFNASDAGCITHIWMTIMEEADGEQTFFIFFPCFSVLYSIRKIFRYSVISLLLPSIN